LKKDPCQLGPTALQTQNEHVGIVQRLTQRISPRLLWRPRNSDEKPARIGATHDFIRDLRAARFQAPIGAVRMAR
jgi:hypothetical protein